MTVNAEGGADAEQLVRRHPATANVPPGAIDAVLIAAAANYWGLSQSPEEPALPGARAYQRAYAEATLRWVDRRGIDRDGPIEVKQARFWIQATKPP